MARFACFGEVLIRLSAPPPERLLQGPALAVHVGGAEANVAVSLARFGHDARMITIVPQNALGDAAIGELRRHGVDVSGVRRVPDGRMGLYFLTHGAGMRASEILYDRGHSSLALARRDAIDPAAALAGADWLHLSGITPALGAEPAAQTLALAAAARASGVKVSFDCNYRAKLWSAWRGDGAAVLRELMAQADLLFADHRDMALVLGRSFDGGDPLEQRRRAADAAFAAFPNLRFMACTQRTERSADDHDCAGHLLSPSGNWATDTVRLSPIVDRIGTGDAFAAGVLHGLESGRGEQWALRFGLAAAALKHSVPGDFNLCGAAEVEAVMAGEGFSVRR
jgi:2-dehydro-3-deoxygluconokinase